MILPTQLALADIKKLNEKFSLQFSSLIIFFFAWFLYEVHEINIGKDFLVCGGPSFIEC